MRDLDYLRKIDAASFMVSEMPDKIFKSGGSFRLKEHDSCVITPKKGWYWFSRGIGGTSAIDLLNEVMEMPFANACLMVGHFAESGKYTEGDEPVMEKQETPGALYLPQAAPHENNVLRYLKRRGIPEALTQSFIDKGLIYEAAGDPYVSQGACVFVGKDDSGEKKYASWRATDGSKDRQDLKGSDKTCGFFYFNKEGKPLHLFESVIDLMSYFALKGECNAIAFGGVAFNSRGEGTLWTALDNALKRAETNSIVVCFDNDDAGREALNKIKNKSGEKRWGVISDMPLSGKDWNEYLCSAGKKPLNNKVINNKKKISVNKEVKK